jgi:hypothetical protein
MIHAPRRYQAVQTDRLTNDSKAFRLPSARTVPTGSPEEPQHQPNQFQDLLH